jgi:leucyl-tRNA synthetase
LAITQIKSDSEKQWSHFTPIHADVSFVNSSEELDIEAFKN